MPVFELPLSELKVYQGRNPRPDDFDQYWERALKELENTDPQPELIRASFQTTFAECFELYFMGTCGARIHAKYLRPKGSNSPHPALLQFHGYSGNCGDKKKLGMLQQASLWQPWMFAVRVVFGRQGRHHQNNNGHIVRTWRPSWQPSFPTGLPGHRPAGTCCHGHA